MLIQHKLVHEVIKIKYLNLIIKYKMGVKIKWLFEKKMATGLYSQYIS